ncbi:uncharacterized protein LOC124887107 [Capsicum annuum]|uniref:uncharacterized protein LOC124887107 n=1 Tax=Capsicum annuum TaxID=4072 RepID=UPI001FB0BE40|nr:uncharacterized protein LOC124887107 [Capsicum annuum]
MLSVLSMGKAVEKEVSVDKLEESNPVESEKLNGSIDISEKEDNKKEEVKKPDPRAFTIPCIVGSTKFTKALCDIVTSINLMLIDIYKKLGLGQPTPTMMRLVMANRLVKRSVGILQDGMVKVDNFIHPSDFVILDCDVNLEVPIILGRPLLATGRVLVDMELKELKFRYREKEAIFKMQPSMKQIEEINIISVVDVF